MATGKNKCRICPPDYKRKDKGPCKTKDCTRKASKLGHCNVHYLDLPVYSRCQAEDADCMDRPHSPRTPYCDVHYERFLRTGTTKVTQAIWQMACGKCLQCMISLEDNSWSKFFCTLRCSKRYYRGRSELPTPCLVCGKDIPSTHVSTKRFCSEKCVSLSRTGNHTAKARGEFNEITREAWLALLSFYGMQCINPSCKKEKGKYGNISRDHILPLALGGKHVIENLQPLCLRCNIKKGVSHIDYRWDRGVEFMMILKEKDVRSTISN